jgi:lysophospholipase L1-like esterase
MKRRPTILCYGDSNTWGFDPRGGPRLPEDTRWPGVLRRCLGREFSVAEDGLNGRTLCRFGMEGDPLNGSAHLIGAVKAYEDLDLVIVYLGINDLFADPHIAVQALSVELEEMLDRLHDLRPSLSVLVLPPLPVNVSREHQAFFHEQVEKSFGLSGAFKEAAERKGCHFLDPSRVISASRLDGVHIEAEEHIKLGLHLCVRVREIVSDDGTPG